MGLTLLISLSGSACKQAVEIRQDSLYGKWDIVRAERNGRETTYLRGGYFVIDQNGSMTINITGEEEKGPFTLQESTLRVNDEKNFLIESLQTDSMRLRFAMSPDSEFLFYLYRNQDEN